VSFIVGATPDINVDARVYFTKSDNIPRIFVAGDTYNENKTWKQRHIFGQQELSLGDEIVIRTVSDIEPDVPVETHEVNITKESEELTNKIIELTARHWLKHLLAGNPIPISGEPDSKSEVEATKEYHCSFCGKEKGEVEKLIAGPDTYICNECISICVDILQGEQEEKKKNKNERNSQKAKTKWPSNQQ
jgi:hypothetical protein